MSVEVRQKELLVLTHTELGGGGTTAVKLGAPWLVKEDSTAGRYFYKPSRVYKGT